ncbi:MAG: hypothetical protein N3A63_09055 [Bacteroidetes bacterium]|nr:hypothetical protein [Bacteroidota bacterium]
MKPKTILGRTILLIVVIATTLGVTLGQNLVVTGSGTFSGSGTIKVKGNINTSGATSAVIIPGTVELTGSSVQDVGVSGKDITFSTLNVLGSSNKVMTVNVAVQDALSINNGAGNYFDVSNLKLTLSGASSITSGTLKTGSGSTVEYNGASGTQTVLGVDYAGNVILSGNASKNLGGDVSVAGILTHSGGNLTVNNNLTLGGAATFATIADVSATKTLTVGTGPVTISTLASNQGTITAAANDGAITITGNATNSGSLVSGSGGISVGGSLNNSGTVTMNDGPLAVGATLQNSGSLSFGSASSTIAAAVTQSGGSLDGGSALVTFNNTFQGTAGTVTAGTGGFVFNNSVTLAGATLTAGSNASIALNGDFSMSSGTISLTGSGTLTIAQGFSISGGTVSFASGSSVSYTGTGSQTVYGTTYGNLLLSGAAKVAGGDLTVSGSALTLNAGLDVGAYTLTMNNAGTGVSGSGEIVGKVRRTHTFTAGTPYAFHRAEVTMALASNATADIILGMYPGQDPASGIGTKYVQRKYTLTSSTDVSANNLTAQLYYTDSELQGSPNEAKLGFYKYSGGTWTKWGTNGGTYTRNITGSSNTIQLSNINQGLSGIAEIGIRSLEYFTIASGAWNAVATWGTTPDDIPGATDDAEVRHAVTSLGGSNQTIANLTITDDAMYDGSLTIDANTFTATSIVTTGTLTVASGAQLVSGSIQNNTGGTSTVAINGTATVNGAFTNNGTLDVNNGGSLTVSGGDLTNAGTITNDGTITVE